MDNSIERLIEAIKHEFQRVENDRKQIVEVLVDLQNAVTAQANQIILQDKLIKDLQEGAADYFLTGTDSKDKK